MFSSPGRGQCPMTFGMAGAAGAEGTIAPEGGCPGKFFTSRKWSYDQAGLTLRDHKGQLLAQLTSEGTSFQGKADERRAGHADALKTANPASIAPLITSIPKNHFPRRDGHGLLRRHPGGARCPNISSIVSRSPATPIAPR